MFTDGRKEYQEMIRQAECGEIDVVVVAKFDRLARDISDATTTAKLLNSYACYLLAGDDVCDASTPVGEFMRNILLAQNQFHARRAASDVMATDCNNARNGFTSGGAPAYGYKIVEKRFVINEEEAPAIKLMFTMTENGKSYTDIQNELKKLGYTTRKGTGFTPSTINSMLKNDKYYGTLVYNRTGAPRHKNRVLIEHFDEVRNEGGVPALITKKQFDKVQEILAARKCQCRPKQNAFSAYVLSGFLYCKQCGHSMTGSADAGGKNKVRRRYYACPNHKKGKSCSTKDINSEYLEKTVKAILTVHINDYLNTNPLGDTVYSDLIKEKQARIAKLNKEISALNEKANKYLEKSVNASEAICERFLAMAEEIEIAIKQHRVTVSQLNVALSALQAQKKTPKALKTEEIFTSDSITREIIGIYVKRIEVDEESGTIEIHYNDE
ncbi:MAG: recombinase family protein [Clostridiales bacterium]|nr:recombinase family protein [Clostridiales bacterium]